MINHEAIARKLGLARTTVTKILNSDPTYRASAETRQQVVEAAQRLGYPLWRVRRRRRFPRKTVNWPARAGTRFLHENRLHDEGEVRVRTLSPDGAMVSQLTFPHLPTKPFVLELEITGGPLKGLTVRGRPLSLVMDGSLGIGLQFEETETSARRRIEEFLMEKDKGKHRRPPRRRAGMLSGILVGLLLSSNASATMLPLFGPEKVVRTTAALQEVTRAFQNCETQAQYQLVVVNGEPDGTRRVSSATLTLNGQEVISPSAFNQTVGHVVRALGALPLDNTLTVRVASKPGAVLTVSVDCTANCLDIQITSPADGSIVNRVQTLVQGTVTTSAEEVGVVVNNFVALMGDGRFATVNVPLSMGTNLLRATVSNPCGNKAISEVVITTEVLREGPVMLTALPSMGLAPLAVTLQASTTLAVPVTEYKWDFDGDGIVDTSGPTLTKVTHTYTQTGLFLPTVTVVDTEGDAFSETTGINVFSLAQLDPMLQKKWTGMQTALARQDVEGALRFIAQRAKERYRSNFMRLKEQLPQMAVQLPEIQFVEINQGMAIYEITALHEGQETKFPVQFIIDADGLWKIRFF